MLKKTATPVSPPRKPSPAFFNKDPRTSFFSITHPIQKTSDPFIQRKPTYLVNHDFMGRTVEVNPRMQTRLQNVQTELQTQYDALPAATRPATLREYAGLSSARGWRSGSSTSKHASGSAVDINYDNQPYIATRSEVNGATVFGGEVGGATPETRALRQPAVEVYDRAVFFTNTIPYALIAAALSATVPGLVFPPTAFANFPRSDVNERRPGESTTDVYRRFKTTSDALVTYFALAFHTNYNAVTRVPVPNIETIAEADLLAGIPLTERKDETTAVADITTVMTDAAWQASHPNYTLTARETYIRMLRDYEHVRLPMVRGNPSITPGNTRNPALGFLHMPEHFVVAMADTGNLRWGAADLGAHESGDMHHFDLGNHGGQVPDGSA